MNFKHTGNNSKHLNTYSLLFRLHSQYSNILPYTIRNLELSWYLKVSEGLILINPPNFVETFVDKCTVDCNIVKLGTNTDLHKVKYQKLTRFTPCR